ncbi:MAG: excinuclease ABC subunit A [Bacteroidetes bacterium]|nr:excinuclease ABC subunit A [Bacteroidota bacterium]
MSEELGCIEIRGARVHNLKNINLKIPRNKLIVITGVSGSGKSSLAFDTIYAEGQRRYVESLSSYARQFLGRMNKPEVDFINGIPPAIAIEQKVNSRNPRSTVGTTTELYDYLRLLYARIGKTISPVSGRTVKRHSVDDIVNYIKSCSEGTRAIILAPASIPPEIDIAEYFSLVNRQGFNRIEINGNTLRIDSPEEMPPMKPGDSLNIVVDRVVSSSQPDEISRIADSVQTALQIGHCKCEIITESDKGQKRRRFSCMFEEDGIHFEEPTEHLFSFNNPLGACPVCEGYGKVMGIDENLVIPDKNLSVYDDAIVCWRGETMKTWKERLIAAAGKFDFPLHKPWYMLTEEQKRVVWTGNRYFFGLNSFFEHLEEKKYKIQYRVLLSRYRGKTTCHECNGNRLRKEAGYVKINGRSVYELTSMPVDKLYSFFTHFEPQGDDAAVAGRILIEIRQRLKFLIDVGLSYLTLNRLSATLSGGESQRINLATSLGSSLVGSLYILDEPSIGLHPRDTGLLIGVLRQLRDIGNTVIVVEHEEEIIRAADMILDLGPLAGRDGGEVVFNGTLNDCLKSNSLTSQYLTGRMSVGVPPRRRKWNSYIEIRGARENNLKNITVRFPLHTLTCVTGVSGSGKSTLVTDILYRAVNNIVAGFSARPGEFSGIAGDAATITSVELIDQNPIGKSSRSNPVTYLKAYDEIRKLFSEQQASVQMGFRPSHFSFNIDGGRCDECQGEGIIRVEMQFMADVELTCEACSGKRFKRDILDVRYCGKNIHDILEMTIDEAIGFFTAGTDKSAARIAQKLTPLASVGLGYVRLGQASGTLSGGESQRVKLAYFIGQEKSAGHILFIFDEPTTGLHFHDIAKLLQSMQSLISHGHSVVLIEHNPDVIRNADWIIDLGPEGGEDGGGIICEGTPEEIMRCPESHTGKYLNGTTLP